MQFGLIRFVDRFRTDITIHRINDSDDWRFTIHANASVALGCILILRFTTNVGFDDVDQSEHEPGLSIGDRHTHAIS